MKSGTDFRVPLRMNCNNIGDNLTFPLAPSIGQNLYLFKILASALLCV